VPLAIVLMLLMRRTRLIGLALVLFYGGMLTLSAMEMYPLGGRRTDIFSYPITLLAIVAGIWAISRWITFLPHAVLIIVVGWMILLPPRTTFIYPQQSDRRVVELLAEQAHDADGIIIGPRSNWAVGCYGPWPVELERARGSSNGFIVLPRRERLIALCVAPLAVVAVFMSAHGLIGTLTAFFTAGKDDDSVMARVYDYPEADRLVEPFLSILPLQLISYYTADYGATVRTRRVAASGR
jgi:hypothetical protein